VIAQIVLISLKGCTMNRISALFSALFSSDRSSSVHTAQNLLERAMHARGQSQYEAAQLLANAQAVLSIVR
jgi:hypothetical protein